MSGLRESSVLFSLSIICLQYHAAMKCNYNKDVLLEEVQDMPFGQAIKKHIKSADDMSIVQCHCTNQNKVISYYPTSGAI